MTKKESKEWDHRNKEMFAVFRPFQKEFWDGNRNWKLDKNDLINAIEVWADKQEPGNVDLCGCDDSYHMSSDLVMIHHIWTESKTKKKHWWGTTVILITQDGQPPAEFFLYPGHAKGLIDCLGILYKIKEQR